MKEVALAIAFAFFIMCPRMAGMCAVISKVGGVNPYTIAFIGGLIAVPLIVFMVFLTVEFGVTTAIVAAVITDILASVVTGTFRLRYGIEIIIIALFIWIGVTIANKLAPLIENVFI
ncbi:hypothetical protein [Archaeoglobus sp.]